MAKDEKEQGVRVTAMRQHTYAGKEYQIGDVYTVHGDPFTTQEQYLASLKAAGLAKADGDVWPQTLEEAEAAAAKTAADKAVLKKADESTAVAAMTTDDMPTKDSKATTDQRKPAPAGKK